MQAILYNNDRIPYHIAQNPDLMVGKLINFICNKISNIKTQKKECKINTPFFAVIENYFFKIDLPA